MDIKSKVKRLDLAELEVTILENRGPRVLAAVISPAFEPMDEYDRQTLVWGRLLDDLGDEESRRIEFVYTATPHEVEESPAAANGRP